MVRDIFLLLLARQVWTQQHSSSTSYIADDAAPANNATPTDLPIEVVVKKSHSVNVSGPDSISIDRIFNFTANALLQQCPLADRLPSVDDDNPVVIDNHSFHNDSTSTSTGLSVTSSVESITAIPSSGTDTDTAAAHEASLGALPSSDDPSSSYEDKDSDPLLDETQFLSFEEWKKQNLAKTGQSPENVGRGTGQNSLEGRQPSAINNALDSLGEEDEINLDFGFGNPPTSRDVKQASSAAPKPEPKIPGSTKQKMNDAGTTCKERTNYASFDCAATIKKTNAECKSAASVLVEHKDSYMLNTCSASNKFFIVELCNDILIDTIVLANYEFFSSVFRHFRVSVSDRYPAGEDKWQVLGTFEARNTREIQAFLVENPLIWARYLRIETLSHYGSEYYCPISLLRVHGKTMIQDFRQEELAGSEAHEEEIAAATEPTPSVAVPPGPEVSSSIEQKADSTAQTADSSHDTDAPSPTTVVAENSVIDSAMHSTSEGSISQPQTEGVSTCALVELSPPSPIPSVVEPPPQDAHEPSTKVVFGNATDEIDGAGRYEGSDRQPSTHESPRRQSLSDDSKAASKLNTHSSTLAVHPAQPTSAEVLATSQSSSKVIRAPSQNSPSDSAAKGSDTSSTDNASSEITSPDPTKSTQHPLTSSSQSQPQPSTQESFFKSVHKRLQQLESNSTLSLQYIEEQSRNLRDAFNKVEKRQSTNAITFLSHLNDTVLNELRGYREAYDEIWQSTVVELDNHRDQYQREMVALSSRMTMLADELVWQKRMGILQSTLLLLCLGFVLFAKQSSGNLEIPLLQQMMNRSQAAIRVNWESDPGSPSPENRSPVSLFRRRIWRSGTELGGMTDGSDSRPQTREGLDVHIEPPTPPASRGGFVDEMGKASPGEGLVDVLVSDLSIETEPGSRRGKPPERLGDLDPALDTSRYTR